MSLNNKGFVSTAAIYTIFVAFLMTSILLLGMYSNANDYNTGENSNPDTVTEIEKANPIISSIDAVIVDLEYNLVREYISGESTELNIEVTPVAENDYEIKKYEYSYDGITWNEWLGTDNKNSHIYENPINETLYIKAIDYKDKESEVFSVDLLISRTELRYNHKTYTPWSSWNYDACNGSGDVCQSNKESKVSYWGHTSGGKQCCSLNGVMTCESTSVNPGHCAYYKDVYRTRTYSWSGWITTECVSSSICQIKECNINSPEGECITP